MANEWARNIFECFSNIPWCIITACCPAVGAYNVASRLGRRKLAILAIVLCISGVVLFFAGVWFASNAGLDYKDPAKFFDSWGDANSDQKMWIAFYFVADAIACICEVLFFLLICKMRGITRDQYVIDGSAIGDCCCTTCCWPCVICQMNNQLDHETRA